MSSQGVLPDLFVVPVADLPAVPKHEPIAKQCQREGREHAKSTTSALHQKMREFYRHNDYTDDQMAAQLSVYFNRKIERSTVNARRNELPEIGELYKVKNPNTGVSNTVWGLTEKGRQP